MENRKRIRELWKFLQLLNSCSLCGGPDLELQDVDLNVEDKVTECFDQDYSSQLQEPLSEMDAPPHMNQSEISTCGRTKCIIPKTACMLELLVFNSRESNKKNDTKKKMAPIWKMVADHRFGRPFLKPVTDREAPGYRELVKRPMDLSTIKKGLSNGRIRTSTDFQRDLLLMLQNAVMYNSFIHCIHQKALEIQRDVQELLEVDDHPEVLDVAAVEAALSFCEENDDPQALGGPWDQAVQEHTVKQETLPKSLIPGSMDTDTIMNIMELTDIKAEPSEPEMELAQSEETSVTPHSAFQLKPPVEEFTETSGKEPVKEEEESADHKMKMEEPQCETSQSEAFSNEEEKGMPSEESPSVNEPMKSEPPAANQNKDSQGEEEEEEDDVTSEVGSPEEPKEEEVGEEYLSEMDNEPPISESDDGFSIHNAQLQSHTLADSIPSSPASSQFSVCSEDQEAIQAQKIWKKAIMLVWRAAANHRYANVFLQPVTDDIAPGYHSIVQRPMDLSTIKKNIETGLIRSTAEFQRDIMLMFQNAVMYNSSDHDVYHMAVEMQRDVLEQIQQFLATQLIMQTSESGISAKSLRGRDSTRKQDASEKDSVPMGSPAFLLSLFDGGTRGRRCAIEADMKTFVEISILKCGLYFLCMCCFC
ncbi:bromodomain-containing protein 8-like [Phyllobates terribilis]|uniref:bromodomain-containing protein 8-like n=1 Tax=Phyllobates terribilis TaxID=111132 RepID=UPI003CCB1E23